MARPKNFESITREAFTVSCLPYAEYSRIVGNYLEIIQLERRGTSQISVFMNVRKSLERSKETASAQVDTLTIKDGKQFQGMYRIDDKLEVEFYGSTESYRKLLAMG
jgi:hypothetical protein